MLAATSCNLHAAAAGIKNRWNPQDFYVFESKHEDHRSRIDPKVAATFLALSGEGRLAPWVIALAPVDEIRSAKQGYEGELAKPRIWQSKDVAFIAPTKAGTKLQVAIAVIRHPISAGWLKLYDPDQGCIVCEVETIGLVRGCFHDFSLPVRVVA